MHKQLKIWSTRIKKITWWRLQLRIDRIFPCELESFIRNVPGVIHIGANNGGERDLYAKHGARVVWVEPNPIVFAELEQNIQGYYEQRAFKYLITDKDDHEYEFYIANNNGASSSILEMKLHLDLCPSVRYEDIIKLRSVTLPTLLRRQSIDIKDYPALIMDVQGAELLVLQGAISLLPAFRFIKLEVADFESYKGCCQLGDVSDFLKNNGYREVIRRKFAEHAGAGYYDILYERLDIM